MDTTEQYIKRRILAIPYLGKGEPPVCAFPSDNYPIADSASYDVWVDRVGNWYVFTGAEVCQLERQDQLQAMVTKGFFAVAHLKAFIKFIGWDCELEYPVNILKLKVGSMEQLWQAFVMKERCDKTWDGEDWR